MSTHDNRDIAAVEASYQIATSKLFRQVTKSAGHQNQWPPFVSGEP
jgi:hypothetical protein